MTTGFAVTLAFLAVVFMAVGVGFGVLTAAISPRGMPRATGFDWGMSFGPFGAAVAAVVQGRSRQRTAANQLPLDRPRDRSRWSSKRAADVLITVGATIVVERAGVEIAEQVVARDVDLDTRVEALLIAPAWFALTGVLAIAIGGASIRARLPQPTTITAEDRDGW